jgi:hypothetical protein
VLLCYDGQEGMNVYVMTRKCWRITREELMELYESSRVGRHSRPRESVACDDDDATDDEDDNNSPQTLRIAHPTPTTQAGIGGGIPAPITIFTGEHAVKSPRADTPTTEQYRAALALALALDRNVPEARRRVPLTERCANNIASIPSFGNEVLENPLTPAVRTPLCFGCGGGASAR